MTWIRQAVAVAALAASVLAACARPAGEHPAKRAFYYWRTTFSLSALESETLQRSRVARLYLRLFDVALDRASSSAIPVGRLSLESRLPPGVEIVPVVFLSNSVFEHEADAQALAEKVWLTARTRAETGGFAFHEIQVDCDWSDETRAAFFAFCESLRALAKAEQTQLSATIRLHQIKYSARTGIPPVDRGMLMFYNMGKLSVDSPRVSIFNREEASLYAAEIDRYPLPLDGALPVFSWAIHGRAGRVVGLIEKIDSAALDVNEALERSAPNRYRAAAATLVHGSYLQEGDTLSLEEVGPAVARQAAQLLAQSFHPRGDLSIALFDLDERNLRNYATQDLDDIYSAVH